EGQRQLARLYLSTGTRLMDEGDLLGALVWLTEAHRLDHEGAPDDDEQGRRRDEAHRQRLRSVLAHCPRLLQLWFHDAPIEDAASGPHGRGVVLAGGSVRLLDALTGEPLLPPVGQVAAIRPAAFSPDGRRFLTIRAGYRLRVQDTATGNDLTPEG